MGSKTGSQLKALPSLMILACMGNQNKNLDQMNLVSLPLNMP